MLKPKSSITFDSSYNMSVGLYQTSTFSHPRKVLAGHRTPTMTHLSIYALNSCRTWSFCLRLRSSQSRTNITPIPIPTSTFLSISGPSISESISHINTQYPAASDSSSHLPRSQWRKQPRRAGKLKAPGTNRMSLSDRLEPCRILNRPPMQYPQL